MHVSIQQSYTELKPLPEAIVIAPALMGLIRRVALIASVVFVNVSAGTILGLAGVGVTIWVGTVSGAVVGLVGGLAMALLMRLPTHIETYRLDTLKQIEGVLANKEAADAIEHLYEFFYYPLSGFRQYFDEHVLYRNLAVIGDHIDPTRKDAQTVWRAFLNHLNETPLQMPDGKIHIFQAASLLQRMEGPLPSPAISWLSTRWPNQADLAAVSELSQTVHRRGYSVKRLKEILSKQSPSGLCMMKDKGKLLGYSWYHTKDGVITIGELARRPEAAQLGVGFSLIAALINKYKSSQPTIQLTIERSHPFGRKLVEKMPFKVSKELDENRLLLEVDWSRSADFN